MNTDVINFTGSKLVRMYHIFVPFFFVLIFLLWGLLHASSSALHSPLWYLSAPLKNWPCLMCRSVEVYHVSRKIIGTFVKHCFVVMLLTLTNMILQAKMFYLCHIQHKYGKLWIDNLVIFSSCTIDITNEIFHGTEAFLQ